MGFTVLYKNLKIVSVADCECFSRFGLACQPISERKYFELKKKGVPEVKKNEVITGDIGLDLSYTINPEAGF